ncbi:unnamed protein product [Nesidiocoris tenuis]|uniref:Uncharacterized protein n=1 Tax=Nesidiocoris tenuis TaxID=355587 RepID=A0A6H5HH74_9HEMI|nr:unnamed protein product [Nesidiocoris tenuis]
MRNMQTFDSPVPNSNASFGEPKKIYPARSAYNFQSTWPKHEDQYPTTINPTLTFSMRDVRRWAKPLWTIHKSRTGRPPWTWRTIFEQCQF